MQVLFRSTAAASSVGCAALFYPQSYLFGFLKRRASLGAGVGGTSDAPELSDVSERSQRAALQCAGGGCASILRTYRYGGLHSTPTNPVVMRMRFEEHLIAVIHMIWME